MKSLRRVSRAGLVLALTGVVVLVAGRPADAGWRKRAVVVASPAYVVSAPTVYATPVTTTTVVSPVIPSTVVAPAATLTAPVQAVYTPAAVPATTTYISPGVVPTTYLAPAVVPARVVRPRRLYVIP